MKNAISKDSNSMQAEIFHKKIPKHRRPRFEIKSKEAEYKKIDYKKDQSRRLHFIPFDYYQRITNSEEIGHIRYTMKTSSKIARSLKFDFRLHRDLNNKIFSQISQEVKKAQSLSAFDFNIEEFSFEEFSFFYSSCEINDLALKNLGIGLKPLKYLRYLRIRMAGCGDINNEGVADIGRALRRLVSLEILDLSFDEGGDISDEGESFFWRSLKYLKALKTLNISFHCCQGVAYEKIDVEKTFHGLKSLKEIRLNFCLSESMQIKGIKNISETFKTLTGLEKIDLCLGSTHLTSQGLKELMEGIQGKSKLKKITLEIGSTPVTNKGLWYLKEGFKKLSGIEEIVIDLQRCWEVTKEKVDKLTKILGQIPSLRHLEIKSDFEEN